MSPVPHAGTRVGWGFDAHPLDGEPPLIVGGVSVSSTVGASATSDGDVLAHAVTDAVLGACVLSDIGEHFPSGDSALAGADSLDLLGQASVMAIAAGWQIEHVDATVVVQEVPIAPHRARDPVQPRPLPRHRSRSGVGEGDHHRRIGLHRQG